MKTTEYNLYRLANKTVSRISYEEGTATWEDDGGNEIKCSDIVERRWGVSDSLCMEYDDVSEEIMDNYSPDFFKGKVLLTATWVSSSGSNRISGCRAVVKDRVVYITVDAEIAPIGTCDMVAFLNCIVFKKKDLAGVDEIRLRFRLV